MFDYVKKGLIGMATVCALAACSLGGAQFSPEEIVTQAVNESKHFSAYYSEAQMKMNLEEIQQEMTIREWRDEKASKIRVEVESANGEKSVTVNDGEKILSYTVGEDYAYELGLGDMELPSYRDQVLKSLSMLQERSDIEIVGEDTLLGQDVYHIKATPKQEGGLFGVEEYWIDQKNWFVLKWKNELYDGSKSEFTVLNIDFEPQLDENIFTLDFGDKEIEIRNIEEMNPAQEVSLEEAVELMGEKFLTLEDEVYSLKNIEFVGVDSLSHQEVILSYHKEELPQFSLSIFKPVDDIQGTALFGGEETINVRGTEGMYIKNDYLTMLTWDEASWRYSIMVENPSITLEELKALVEKMEMLQ
ncbi:LolA family protein [Caldalkalibacillus mannanilyticus]|uniref:LolA family protein n=1 Tax=Caldalkalibacillus mannanilyticus TaxID=1418 RepID=UPI00046AD3B6|nr:hypothetical protein [Caldalkalibacillus mannanilyticus]